MSRKPPHWLDPSVVLAIQEELLSEFGGRPGVRDQGLLESAMSRPRQLWHYDGAGLFDLAAAYAFGIANNHPFVDGNKRTAFMAAYVFLELNGLVLEADEAQVVVNTVGLADKTVSENEYAAWLKGNCRKT